MPRKYLSASFFEWNTVVTIKLACLSSHEKKRKRLFVVYKVFAKSRSSRIWTCPCCTRWPKKDKKFFPGLSLTRKLQLEQRRSRLVPHLFLLGQSIRVTLIIRPTNWPQIACCREVEQFWAAFFSLPVVSLIESTRSRSVGIRATSEGTFSVCLPKTRESIGFRLFQGLSQNIFLPFLQHVRVGGNESGQKLPAQR